jgi:hypothetical protein
MQLLIASNSKQPRGMTGFIRNRLSFGEQRHNTTDVHGLEFLPAYTLPHTWH